MAGYKLTASVLNRKKAPGKVADGLALSFKRNKDGTLSAVQRVKTPDGKQQDHVVAVVTGEITQDRLQEIRQQAYTLKTSGKGAAPLAMTFAGAWEAFYQAATAPGGKWSEATASQSFARMLKHVAPSTLWDMPVDRIRSTDIESAIEPVRASRPKLAPKVLALIGNVISYAGHDLNLDVNPASVLKDKLRATGKPVRMEKLPAVVTWPELGRLVGSISASSLYPSTRAALLLQAYTAQRSGEVAGARWDEFKFHDDGTATWIIPRARMKVSEWAIKPYDQVLHLPVPVARMVRHLKRETDYLFVPRHGESDHISVEAFSQAFQRLGFRGLAVPHGWRSSMKTLATEATEEDGRPLFAARWVEDVLDHGAKGIEAHYTRDKAEQGMRRVLAWWADALGKAHDGYVVNPMQV